MVDFAINYEVLHSSKKELHSLSERTGSKLKNDAFDGLTEPGGETDDVFGDYSLSSAFVSLYDRAKGPLEKAEKDLRKLGDLFGSVADAFFHMDAQIADGVGFRGSDVGIDEWKRKYEEWLDHDAWQEKKDLWDEFQKNKDSCTPGDPDGPAYCHATDPGPEPEDPGPPPTSHTIETDDGSTIKTEITLDDDNNVKTETTTITTSGGQEYESVTTFDDDTGDSYTTETTYADGSTATAEVDIKRDDDGNIGEGSTMTVTDGDGNETEFVPDGHNGWEKVGGDADNVNEGYGPSSSTDPDYDWTGTKY